MLTLDRRSARPFWIWERIWEPSENVASNLDVLESCIFADAIISRKVPFIYTRIPGIVGAAYLSRYCR